MFQYILKRIIIFIPTFFAISLIIFGLSKMAPGDPVEVLLSSGSEGGAGSQNLEAIEDNYLIRAKKLGLDKPSFYFAFTSVAYPNDLYKIVKMEHRELVSRLISVYGNSDAVKIYYSELRNAYIGLSSIPALDELFDARSFYRDQLTELFREYEEKTILFRLDTLEKSQKLYTFSELKEIHKQLSVLKSAFLALKTNATPYKLYIPSIQYYGFDNQYHTWMFGDYPWLQSVDSTNYIKLEKLYAEIGTLRNKEDSLLKIQKPYIAKSRIINELILVNDSTKQYKPKEIDSLQNLLVTLNKDIAVYDAVVTPMHEKIVSLNQDKDLLNKSIKLYAGKGFLRGDFGTSYSNGLPVSKRITDALFWTLLMNLLSIIVSYLISIPLGVQSAYWKKHSYRYEPLLTTEAFIFALLMVTLFYTHLGGTLSPRLYYPLLISLNLVYLVFLLWKKQKASRGKFSMASVGLFWLGLVRFKIINLADNSTLILKLLYLWIWAFVFFLFLLFPITVKFIIISIPLAILGIRKLRKSVKEKTDNFKISFKGIYAKGSVIDNLSTTVLFILYSLPSFWIGTLLIVFFTTKNYGVHFNWFPTSGVQSMAVANNPDASGMTVFLDIMYHLFLPTFCITFSSFAYLSRQMRGAMLGVLRQDYIRTANSKGLSEHKVIWKHAFRNSLFPIITLFSSVFPRALSGAIAIELIYNIPGMGVLVLKAIGERDWPIVFTVAMLAAILTMIGNLIADILYAVVDPRISFK